MKIHEVRCTECFEPVEPTDIYFEPPEPETGHYAYAETRCCGSQEVYLLRHEDDPEPDRVNLLDQELYNYWKED